ncbi:ABC transporter permease [bacterium]|nr:ABC transporter permease [bacterium]
MTRLWDLVRNTFRETIRDRVLYVILVFAFVMIGASTLFGTLTVGQDRKIILDLGLAAIELFGVAIAVFVGTNLLFKEIDKRTVYVVLTKPIPRSVFLLGKFFGLALTLGLLLVLMGGAYLALASVKGAYSPALLGAIALIGLQLLVVVALTLFFSTFASPIMSMVFTTCLYFIGHNTEALRALAQKASPLQKAAVEALYYVLPNLSTFDAKNMVVYGDAVSAGRWLWAIGYAAAYVCALLATASALFERKEF